MELKSKVPGTYEAKDAETHMTSAVAFVEGGIQESCDDACSICLEGFRDSDPKTVTSCKHEFHLQCILEWRQRSFNCPMCWQRITLKDPASQELLEAVEREKSLRSTPSRATAIFRHPTLGDFELPHLPVGVSQAELQERILQHFAAADTMGRFHRVARREGSRRRSSAHARPQYVLFSGHPPASSAVHGGQETQPTESNPSVPSSNNIRTRHTPSPPIHSTQNSASSSRPSVVPVSGPGLSNDNRNYVSQSSFPNQDRGRPSESQSFSDSWKSRFSSMSIKYKDSISRSTKGLKEKLFSRSASMSDIGSGVKREVSAGLASVSRMMERLESNIAGHAPVGNSAESCSSSGPSNTGRDAPSDSH